ncbi:lectin alpha chain [Trifolium pratense]|uniref:Lectin alpha chain n=1 Tax=Trifolium pratense TaxID=57577 RepID=A0A2K3JQV7_TRIPR|nr:lectin alpha chain [Trifolium pratense]
MALSNLKSNRTTLSSQLIKIFIAFLFLQYHNVNSQYSQSPIPSQQLSPSETFSFSITEFDEQNQNIFLGGDASTSGGILRLTKTDEYGKPLQNSVGRVTHFTPIHIWDKASGELADFSVGFSFNVNTNGSRLHGDGFTFFIGPVHFELPKNSSGGFTNGWDPATPSQFPHIGIDVGSIDSVATVNWPIDFVQTNALGVASINYNSESKKLSVFVVYPGSEREGISVSSIVDLRSVLPEWVRVGFTASTGELVETHDIINWSFESAL